MEQSVFQHQHLKATTPTGIWTIFRCLNTYYAIRVQELESKDINRWRHIALNCCLFGTSSSSDLVIPPIPKKVHYDSRLKADFLCFLASTWALLEDVLTNKELTELSRLDTAKGKPKCD